MTCPRPPRKARIGAHTSGSRAQTFAALTPTHRPRRLSSPCGVSSVALRLRQNEFQRLATRDGCRGRPCCFRRHKGADAVHGARLRPRGPNRCSGAPLRARCRGLTARRCRRAAILKLSRLGRVNSRRPSRGQTLNASRHHEGGGCVSAVLRPGGRRTTRQPRGAARTRRMGLTRSPSWLHRRTRLGAGLQPLVASARSRGAKRPSSGHSRRCVNYPQERVFRSFP